jgi:ubiquinone/menaquinone biosynthesis C-methylase UbiE
MSSPATQPSPQLFFQTALAYQRTEAIKAAVELDVFTIIAEGNSTAEAIANRCQASARGMRILCDFLAFMGFLTKDGKSYVLTQDSAMFLNKKSPAYVGGAIEFLLSPMLMEGMKHLTEAVRKGGTAVPEGGTMAPEHPVWVKFAEGMGALMFMPSQVMAKLVDPEAKDKLKILDIAAGHGFYGIAFATKNPNAEVVALDWPNVLQVARKNAAKMGVADRHSTIEGSAFDADFGGPYDLILLTNFLHHFDPPTCERLIRKAHAALAEGGRVATLEFVPNEDRISPPEAAAFAVTMLGSTEAGDAYTFAEFDRMFKNAGFARSEIHALQPGFQHVIISYK